MSELVAAVSEKDHVQGNADAEITLVEYGDFQCPDCGMAYPMVKKLQKQYGKRLRLVYRNFPLEDVHPLAEPAAEAAEFAGSKGKFWEMHDVLFEQQRRLSEKMLAETAESLGLDGKAASKAIGSGAFGERIAADVTGGSKAGVHATPTFFINGEMYEGEWEFSELAEAIDAALEAAE